MAQDVDKPEIDWHEARPVDPQDSERHDIPLLSRNNKLRKRFWLFVWFAVIAVIIVLTEAKPVAPWIVIILVALTILILTLVLSLLKTKEGKYFDYWSIVHFLSGVLLGLLCVPFLWTLFLLVLWEIVEILGEIKEYLTNSITDIIIAVVGWYLAKIVFAGPLLLL